MSGVSFFDYLRFGLINGLNAKSILRELKDKTGFNLICLFEKKEKFICPDYQKIENNVVYQSMLFRRNGSVCGFKAEGSSIIIGQFSKDFFNMVFHCDYPYPCEYLQENVKFPLRRHEVETNEYIFYNKLDEWITCDKVYKELISGKKYSQKIASRLEEHKSNAKDRMIVLSEHCRGYHAILENHQYYINLKREKRMPKLFGVIEDEKIKNKTWGLILKISLLRLYNTYKDRKEKVRLEKIVCKVLLKTIFAKARKFIKTEKSNKNLLNIMKLSSLFSQKRSELRNKELLMWCLTLKNSVLNLFRCYKLRKYNNLIKISKFKKEEEKEFEENELKEMKYKMEEECKESNNEVGYKKDGENKNEVEYIKEEFGKKEENVENNCEFFPPGITLENKFDHKK